MTAGPVSIAAELSAAGQTKSYLGLLAADGCEWGVGRAGRYPAHAHRGLTDVLFSPGGLLIRTAGGTCRSTFFACSPGSWFDPVQLADFCFVKFFQTARDATVAVPDKVTDPAATGDPGGAGPPARSLAADSGLVSYPFFDVRHRTAARISFAVRSAPVPQLEIAAGPARWTVRP
jgi:hypothetical protein